MFELKTETKIGAGQLASRVDIITNLDELLRSVLFNAESGYQDVMSERDHLNLNDPY
jgi:hypothetical protein